MVYGLKQIYLDHAATTPMHPEVVTAMVSIFEETFGNPSSVHHFGRKARQVLDKARFVISKSIGASDKEIIFTGGGTEADNLAIIGTALANKHKGKHIITTKMEHHASLHAAEYLEKHGFHVTYLPIDETGKVSIKDMEEALTDETILVSIMYVNNETGVIQPITEVGQLLKNHQAYFHTDAVQAYGLIEIDVHTLAVDFLTASAHKINGPKGVGFLYARNGTNFQSLQLGGEQERKRRAGTENTAAIYGLQRAVELMVAERPHRKVTYENYKKLFIEQLNEHGVVFTINGDQWESVPTIVNISFPGTNVETLLTNFDLAGVAASSGSACTAGSVEPSHVLAAMYGSGHECTMNSIRFSFGLANNEQDIKESAQRIADIIKRVKK